MLLDGGQRRRWSRRHRDILRLAIRYSHLLAVVAVGGVRVWSAGEIGRVPIDLRPIGRAPSDRGQRVRVYARREIVSSRVLTSISDGAIMAP
jgi:hypothetical protein